MTKVQLTYHLIRPLDEKMMERISDAHGQYGIERITVATSLDEINVEYDATRLSPDKVISALRRAGIPAQSR
jgi:copper chaperone CopZ